MMRASSGPVLFSWACATLALALGRVFAADGLEASLTPPVSIVVPADAVHFTIRIRSDQEVADYQLYELDQARKLLLDAIQHDAKFTLDLDLGARPSRSLSLSSASGKSVEATVNLFYPVKTGFNYLTCVREVNALVAGIRIPEKARFKYQIDDLALWVAAPENSRPQLLKIFAGKIQEMAGALGGKVKFSITNLLEPISQRPAGDSQVELSLQPQVTLELD